MRSIAKGPEPASLTTHLSGMDSAGAHRGDLEFEPRGVWSPAHPRRIAGRGRRVGHKRVARLMQQAGSERAGRHRSARATTRGEATRPAPALVERDISATGPTNWGGRHHLRADLGGVSVPGGGAGWSRRVVGWSLAGHLRRHPELVQEALTWPSGSRPWSASCWSGADFAVAARRAWPCSSSLRVLQPAPASLGAGLPLAGRNVRQKWQHQRCLAGNLGTGSPPWPAVHRSASESASERPPEPLPNPGVYPRVPPETLKVPVNAVSQSLWLRAIRRPRRPPGPAIKDTPARSSCCCSEPITSACRRAAGRVRGRSGSISISISAAVRLSRELPGPPEPSDPAAPPAPLRNGAQ